MKKSVLFGVCVALCCSSVRADSITNLITVNPSFETNPTTYQPAPTPNSTAIPGWFGTATANGSYFGTAGDQPSTTGRDGLNFAYAATGATLSTLASDRPAITVGDTYKLDFLLKNDSTDASNSETVSLNFYADNTTQTATPVGTVSFTYTLPDKNATTAFTSETFTGIAPAGASYAGVATVANATAPYTGYIMDNFNLNDVSSVAAAPLPSVGWAGALLMGGLAVVEVRRRSRVASFQSSI